MLTQTTETAIKAMLFLAQEKSTTPISLLTISDKLVCSPTYLSKILSHLIKPGILTAVRGSKGGMTIARSFDSISLLDIVQACQGVFLPDFCDTPNAAGIHICGFHQAMYEVRKSTLDALSKWKLSDLLKQPEGNIVGKTHPLCKMKLSNLNVKTGKNK